MPDLIGVVQDGVVYTSKTKKIAEHGGDDPQDRNVPLVVSGPRIRHDTQRGPVGTTQIAPTILALLGLDAGRRRTRGPSPPSALRRCPAPGHPSR